PGILRARIRDRRRARTAGRTAHLPRSAPSSAGDRRRLERRRGPLPPARGRTTRASGAQPTPGSPGAVGDAPRARRPSGASDPDRARMTALPAISVVIPTHGRLKTLRTTLAAL